MFFLELHGQKPLYENFELGLVERPGVEIFLLEYRYDLTDLQVKGFVLLAIVLKKSGTGHVFGNGQKGVYGFVFPSLEVLEIFLGQKVLPGIVAVLLFGKNIVLLYRVPFPQQFYDIGENLMEVIVKLFVPAVFLDIVLYGQHNGIIAHLVVNDRILVGLYP